MDPITGGTCKCNATSSSVQDFGVIVNDVTWNPPNLHTCHGRGATYFIKCVDNSGLESSSSEITIILLGFCLLFLLISTSLLYKIKKDKSYYQAKIEALEKEDMGSFSNDPRISNA